MRYSLRRVSPMGALLYGLLLGLGCWLIPGAILGWLVRLAVVGIREWLAGWRLVIPLPIGEGITIDLTSALSLSDAQARLTALAGQEVPLMLAVALGTIAAGMLLTGLISFLVALAYNLFAGLFGGIEVKLDALDAPARGPNARTTLPPNARPPVTPATVVVRPPVSAWLTASGGGNERRALRDDVTRIGSAPDNDIVLPGLAAQHAEIRRESGRYLIYDLGSRRTWVNDAQVAAVHMLKDGFRLQLGQTEFVVHIPAPQAPAEER